LASLNILKRVFLTLGEEPDEDFLKSILFALLVRKIEGLLGLLIKSRKRIGSLHK